MAQALVPDALWAVIAPLLPPARPRPKGGRPPIPDRAALTGILFVLRTGLPWEYLPQEMGCGSGMSCCGGCAIGRRQACGRPCTAPCWKRHLVVDARGTPLGVVLTGANRHDSTQLVATLDAIPPARSPAPQAGQAACGQGLRPAALPTGMPDARDRTAHRAPGHRVLPAPGTPPPGRGTHAQMAGPLPPPCHPLRATRQHPIAFTTLACLCPCHTQSMQTVLSGNLRRQ